MGHFKFTRNQTSLLGLELLEVVVFLLFCWGFFLFYFVFLSFSLMAMTLLHPSLRLQALCSGIPVWFSHGAALFPYHFPVALYCIFITAEAVSTGPSGYLF